MVSDDRTRGQVILIGALSLAFIILGIVVVFNGVLYTETLSSVTTGQGVSDASVTEQEIKHGIGCLIDQDPGNASEKNLSKFSTSYQNTTVNSESSIVSISSNRINSSAFNITIEYDSADGTYTKENLTINGTEDCPA
ncbi:hypothetical protein [Natrinema sp. HArc-T2]|uniref:hypothetical protein n=1 Tax=Natrinema sp. HArc-T2 TaxID=3242701 RepID=UPI00359E688B